jgi:serine/threonine protein kinase
MARLESSGRSSARRMDTYVVRYVCAAHWAYSRQILCRKEISYSKMSPKEREQLQAELSILKELVHPNIVRYYEREHLKASQDLHLYMEYCGNGDLGRVIQKLKNNGKNADEEFVWSIFSQIVSALYRCHHGQGARSQWQAHDPAPRPQAREQ